MIASALVSTSGGTDLGQRCWPWVDAVMQELLGALGVLPVVGLNLAEEVGCRLVAVVLGVLDVTL
ncbi:hypothetical protein [Actinomadura sp. 6K520]|uniref:hypothetical protein n=1 Tax=Actinomadura sp. 6K520 TaxID=2530364 RepID=UPI0010462F68|nr:hypothetical protein [Actinomadura sp. 6K520]TDE20440.1 hypothetical protein E1289_32100 [Actinomadura sp. 6K520]